MNFDTVLDEIGGSGRAQNLLTLFVAPTSVLLAMNTYAQMFMQGDDDYRCLVPECENSSAFNFNAEWLNYTTPYEHEEKSEKTILSKCKLFKYNSTSIKSQCSLDEFQQTSTMECTRWVFKSSKRTLTKEWDLVCKNHWKLTLTMSAYMAGFLCGVFFFGFLSDRIGRRKSVLIAVVILILSSFANIFSPSLPVFGVFRFLIAASGIGLTTNTFVLLTEYTGPKHRDYGVWGLAGWQLGEFTVIGLAYVFHDWRHVQISIFVLSLFFLLYFCLLPESARWLISRRRYDEAKIHFQTLAKWQRKDINEDSLHVEQISFLEMHSLGVTSLFRTPRIRKRFIIVALIWFFDSLITYNITLGARNIPGSIFVNFACITTADATGMFISIAGIKYLKRRNLLSFCFVVVGIASFAKFVIAADDSISNIALVMIGKVTVSICFIATYVYTAELFPTPIRNIAMGTGSMCSRVGGIIAPLVVNLVHIWRLLPWLIVGVSSFVAAISVWFLAETAFCPLPSTIDEVERNKEKDCTGIFSFCNRSSNVKSADVDVKLEESN